MSILSSNPFLANLFLSYADRAAALGSASVAPSPESEERRPLRETVITLLVENQNLKSEAHGVIRKLETTGASRKAFHSRVSSLKDANAAQRDDINSLRAQLVEVEDKYDRFMADSNAEKAGLQMQVLGLEVRL